MYDPEPRLDPPEPFCVVASCGHEVYSGEHLYKWENGKILCPDCMEAKFNEQSLDERAALLGCEWVTV